MRTLQLPVIFLILSALLSACTTIPTPQERLPGSPLFPPLSLMYKRLSEDLRKECNTFRSRSFLHHCTRNEFDLSSLQQALSASGRFQQLTLAQPDENYQLLTSVAVLDQETGSEFSTAVLSGATLMMLPMLLERTIRAELMVTWREIPIKSYDYTIPLRFSVSIFNAEQYQEVLTAAIAERLLADLEMENIFTGAYLLSAIEASDYEKELNVPEQVGDYVLSDKHIYNNPFFGTLLTFEHRQFAFDRAEVFIYPIPSTEWNDTQALTWEEAQNLRNDMVEMQRTGELKSVISAEPQALHWKIGQRDFNGSYYTSKLTDHDDQQADVVNYVFTSGDKFVRVHTYFPVEQGSASTGDPDDFARQLLHTLSLPVESVFMARLREVYRQSGDGT
ncbi:hypothetical protein Maes01_01890 [Microbulbifer aestuariivivens]|uniref:Uncharacterized protein n=1 Tax=Microbulbifer aestuariivivens TaxID=1908308 RepID=A0ABP9WQM4_9GAMM